MKNHFLRASTLALAGTLAGCGGDDITFAPDGSPDTSIDGNTKKDSTVDAKRHDAGKDASSDAALEAEAGSAAQHVLVTSNNSMSSELIAVNVATKAVDGTYTFPSSLGQTYTRGQPYPFLLEQATNVVARLDSNHPWLVDSSWNVTLSDTTDGGYPYSDPVAVVVGPAGKAYVLRYDRNEIAVIQANKTFDAGLPPKTIDLSALVQKNDSDGVVEMSTAVYVGSKNLLYVVLENIDENAVSSDGVYLYCTGTTSTIVGIDTTTDAIASLGGTGPGGSIALKGYNPVPGGMAVDTTGNRMLLFEEGCYARPSADAGAGPRSKGGVEAVSLADLSTAVLLDISRDFAPGAGYPSGIVYIDTAPPRAVLGFDFTGSETRHWDPASPKLGAKIPTAPDVFTYDGAGNLVGTLTTYGDGGTTSTKVISVAIGTGNQTPLSIANPFTMSGGFVGGVDVWPHP